MTSARVLLCCGTGGVGKTTAAAALGVAAALDGQRAAVLTIDPARRLADALGLGALDNEPRPVDLSTLPSAASGSLHALMLDRKATFDDAIRDLSSDPESAERLLANRYYRAVSTRLTGAHEYMAAEKLHALLHSGRFDVVIVDTPPSRHAIDFFRAPDRVQTLFDGAIVRRLINPRRGLTGGGTRRLLSWILSLVGRDVLDDIGEFFRLMSGVTEGFAAHGAEISRLLKSDRATLLLVSTAATTARSGALSFVREVRADGLQLGGFVLNRFVEPADAVDWPEVPEADRPTGWDAWRAVIRAEAERRDAIAARHAAAARDLSQAAGGIPVYKLPLITDDLGSVQGLATLARRLPPLHGREHGVLD